MPQKRARSAGSASELEKGLPISEGAAINIDAAREFRPLKRVYISDQQSYGSVRNDLDITRTQLLSTLPVRILERIRVTITLENGESPPETGRDHDFTLTVFSVQNEIALPGWLNQTFVL